VQVVAVVPVVAALHPRLPARRPPLQPILMLRPRRPRRLHAVVVAAVGVVVPTPSQAPAPIV